MRYVKYYTVKEWKKFDKVAERENGIDITMQEILLQKYDVILTDYKTKKEKLFQVLDKFNAKNINAGITKFNKAVNQFTKTIESTNKSKGPSLKGLMMTDTHKPRKTISFWDEPRETRKRRNKRKPKQKEPDYSALIGKKRMKFF